MTESNSATAAPLPQKPAHAGTDHSRAIRDTLAKEPRDQITCVRVFDDFYRCNWWAPASSPVGGSPLMEGLAKSTYRVRKSNFIKATMNEGQLLIVDATLKRE